MSSGRHSHASSGSSVGFVSSPPEVHVIPADMATWADGERSLRPSDSNLANAEQLAERAMHIVMTQEALDGHYDRTARFHEDFDAPFIPSLIHDNPFTAATSTSTTSTPLSHGIQRRPRTPPIRPTFQNDSIPSSHKIPRKPLPSRSYTLQPLPSDTFLSHRPSPSAATYSPPSRPTLATAHTFNDFLASDRVRTWEEIDMEKSKNKGFKKATSRALEMARNGGSKAVGRFEVVVEGVLEAKRGGPMAMRR